MKTYKATTRTSKGLREAISNTLSHHDKFKSSYMWHSNCNASSRRWQEEKFAADNPAYTIKTKSGDITVQPDLRISCKNVYYSLEILVNGEKKNIRAIKGLL